MTDNGFTRRWLYDPARPRLADYPTETGDHGLPVLETALEQIGEYQRRLWANRNRAVLLVVHGPDTSGKDSLIRTLATYVDPAGFHAWSFSRPQGAEARHDFLWRVVPYLPAYGEMVAFNRSHHEAVMAERVWPVRDPQSYDWDARYAAIRHFEQHLVAEGTTILKVWLNLSEDEHRERLLRRLDKPRKRWKFTVADIDGWEQRSQYNRYAEQALARTHTESAPWLVVPGDHKPRARAIVARMLADRLQQLAPEYPAEDAQVLAHYRQLLAERGVG